MNQDQKALKQALRQRQLELQGLIKQMKSDNLQSGSLYKNLEEELDKVKDKIQEETNLPERK